MKPFVKSNILQSIVLLDVLMSKKSPRINKTKNLIKKKKREINLYSEEYLKKKHGLTIGEALNNKKISKDKKTVNKSNFFNYLFINVIIVIALFGILNLTKDFIILGYPFTEPYINSLYEILNILSLTISNFVN